MLETGALATMSDIAATEDVTPAYVGRVLKLAYLAPAVLEKLVIARVPPAVSVKDLILDVDLLWDEQEKAVFEFNNGHALNQLGLKACNF